jgi:hypothetical protein
MKKLSLTSALFVVATVAIAVSSALLPLVTGYGTWLFQLLVFRSWHIVAYVNSGMYGNSHPAAVFVVAGIANVALFLLPAFPIHIIGRNRCPVLSTIAIFGLALFQISCLFVLFPATDGP